jgi:hypothetical protein
MHVVFDRRWAEVVCGLCDPVFAAADVGFERQISEEPGLGVTAMLWEADPHLFEEKYPDSGIAESYGDQWPAPCIDFWVYVDGRRRQARTSTEGCADQDVDALPLTGDGVKDGVAIGSVMACILRVSPPRV